MVRTVIRTKKTFDKYEEYKKTAPSGCPLCRSRSVREFTHLRLIENDFPYDAIADRHCMLVPKRHVALYSEFTDEERAEFEALQTHVEGFDAAVHNASHTQTVPGHFHVHLIKYKTAEE